MENEQSCRADKFLWNVRIFKTRVLSQEACKKGWVTINDVQVKPSRIIKKGEIIRIKKAPVLFTYTVKSFPKSRIPHKLVGDFIEDNTSQDELHKLTNQDSFFIKREKGTGRPTKKERRDLDKFRIR